MTTYKLHRAVKNGDLQRVNELLSEPSGKVDIDQPDSNHWTPLMYAVASPIVGVDILRALIRCGVTIDPTSVSFALSDLQKLALLIEAGADVLYQKEHGYDALINAAYGQDVLHNPHLLDILELLIAKGVPLRGMTTYDESAVRVLSRIGRFDAVQFLLKAGANPDDVKLTQLIEAIAFGSLTDVATLVKGGANLEERDFWERTPWLVAIQTGDMAKAKFLFEHGADRDAKGRCGKPSLFYAIENGHIPMLKWLLEIGIDIEQTDEFGDTALREAVECCNEEAGDILLRAGANVHHESKTGTALSYARTRGIAMKLLDAGADPQNLTSEGRRAILGFPPESEPDLLNASGSEVMTYRFRIFGRHNPEVMNNTFWEGMIRSGVSAYQARQLLGIEEKLEGKYTSVWCAQRFGQSVTFLPDGRIVQVAGEHEDHYDPDFCIYNDVFLHSPDGNMTIYGYPESAFPPTDFHTATLIGNFIYLIGSLGYPSTRRYSETQVSRLNVTSFEMERVETIGSNPGWIYKHRAILFAPHEIRVVGGSILSMSDDKEVLVENRRSFVLDIQTGAWRVE